MLLQIGKVNIQGGGYYTLEGNMKDNMNFSISGDVICQTAPPTETYDFTIHGKGGCSVDRAFRLWERLQAELEEAVLNGGHMVYKKQLLDYSRRWELLGGTADLNSISEHEFLYGARMIEIALSITVRRSIPPQYIILSPALTSASFTWGTDDIRARLLDVGGIENTGSGYSRVKITGAFTKVVTPQYGPVVTGYCCNDITFPLLGNSAAAIGALEIATQSGTVLATIPSTAWSSGFLGDNGQFNPGGNTVVFRVNADGLVYA